MFLTSLARGRWQHSRQGTTAVARSSCSHVMTRSPLLTCKAANSESSSGNVSFIPETLEQLRSDPEFQSTKAALEAKGQQQLTREEARAIEASLRDLSLPSFSAKIQDCGQGPLVRGPATTLQLNIGLYCNQACSHCHVESSPLRTEMMDVATAERCLQLLAECDSVTCLDITGGAPELNTQFRHLVSQARSLRGSIDIIDRCNLTVLCEPGQEDLPEFLSQHQVHVVASLPCYSAANVDSQRGRGVFERSIEGLRKLNAVGYGQPGSGLQLDLVYNPNGSFLTPAQSTLEPVYKQELKELYGIEFNSLFCLNNMPIKRFAEWLIRKQKLSEYMQLLVNAFNPSAITGLMCTNTVSVSWDGTIYDCDFNQQLALTMMPTKGAPSNRHSSSNDKASTGQQQQPEQHRSTSALTVWDVASLTELTDRTVRVGSHCYGCTAGFGSSCQGSTT